MEYFQYFRLDGPPFQPASRDGAVYFSPTHLEGLATLEAGLSGELNGLTLLTGEAGTGKTTLIYSLLQRDFKRVRIAHIDDPKLSFLEIMRLNLTQMNLYSAGTTKLDYLKTMDHLLDLHGKEERIAIVVDEAQVLSDDVLEELRLLWNRGQRNDRCLLQVVLVGQPELAERLKKPELRQLNQRISSRGVLKPLTVAQGSMYVECKLGAQGSKCSTIFEPRALNHLLRYSDGIPRKINMLCHNAMVAAFYAGERKVSFGTAKQVAAEYHDAVGIVKPKSRSRSRAASALFAGVALAALLLVGFVYPNQWSDWILRHTRFGRPTGQTVQPREIANAGRSEKPGKSGKTVAQSGIEGRPDARAKTAIATSSASQTVASGSSVVPGATAPTGFKSDVAQPPTTLKVPALSTAPASAAGHPVVQQPPAASGLPPRDRITVKDGDTLEDIAIQYFGSKSGIDQLVKANPQLTNINRLTVGQVIYLPAGASAKASPGQTATSSPGSTTDHSPE